MAVDTPAHLAERLRARDVGAAGDRPGAGGRAMPPRARGRPGGAAGVLGGSARPSRDDGRGTLAGADRERRGCRPARRGRGGSSRARVVTARPVGRVAVARGHLPALTTQRRTRGGRLMRHALAIARREIESYFVSPIAYAVMTVFTFVSGLFFSNMLVLLRPPGGARRLADPEGSADPISSWTSRRSCWPSSSRTRPSC